MTAAQPPAPPVPPLYCPLPSAIHPDAAAIAQSSMDWLAALGLFEREGLRDRMVRTHAAEWASRIAPFGERRRLQIVSDWTHLGFAIDDCRFDAGPLVDQPADLIPSMMGLMPHLDHPEAPTGDDLFARGLRDLSVRARACAPAAVVRNWVEGNMEWFFAVACLTSYRAAGTMPSLAAYVDLGPRDRAMKLTGSLIELAEGTFLPHDERESPPVRAVTQAANLLVTKWSLRVPRYRHSARSRPPGPPFAHAPSDTTATTPPIPAIAWWWDEPEPPPSFAIEVLPEWPRPRTSRLIKDAHRRQPTP